MTEASPKLERNRRFRKDTESRMKDAVYNKIVDRYSLKDRDFVWHDQLIWVGAIYTLPEIFGYMVFFAIFLLLAKISFEKYGDARTIVYFILLVVWRIQVAVKLLGKINRKLS